MSKGITVDPSLINNLKGLKERAQERSGGSSDITWYKPKDGQHKARILPGLNDLPFVKERGTHWDIGDDNTQVRCPNTTGNAGNPCYICEVKALFERTGDKEDMEMAATLTPKVDYLMNIIDRDDESTGVKVWSAPPTVIELIVGYVEKPEWGAVWDAAEGTDLIVHRKKSGNAFDYKSSTFDRFPSPISSDEEEMKEWLGSRVDLETYVKPATYAETYEALTGEKFEGEEPEKNESEPVEDDPTPEPDPEPVPDPVVEPEPEKEEPKEDDTNELKNDIRAKLAKLKEKK